MLNNKQNIFVLIEILSFPKAAIFLLLHNFKYYSYVRHKIHFICMFYGLGYTWRMVKYIFINSYLEYNCKLENKQCIKLWTYVFISCLVYQT